MRKKVVIIGAGRSGRGMLGEQFFSEGEWDIIFADNDAGLVNGLRAQGWYGVEQKGLISGKRKYTRVEGFEILNTETDRRRYIEEMAQADIVATALFPEAFDQVARDMAESIALRCAQGRGRPAAYLLGANFVYMRRYFYPRITTALSETEKACMDRDISLVVSMVNRKVVWPKTYAEDRYALTGDDKPVLKVDNSLHPNFNAAPSFFSLTDNLDAGMCEKIWTGNLDHCSFAFMGAQQGYETINQTVRDNHIRTCAYYAWLEGRQAILKEFGIPIPPHNFKVNAYRMYASPHFSDSLKRIARDPIRKLKKHDRFLGPALLCLKHRIEPTFILKCASYGFLYRDDENAQAVELRRLIREKGIEAAILDITGLDLSEVAEGRVYQALLNNWREISGEMPIRPEEIEAEGRA